MFYGRLHKKMRLNERREKQSSNNKKSSHHKKTRNSEKALQAAKIVRAETKIYENVYAYKNHLSLPSMIPKGNKYKMYWLLKWLSVNLPMLFTAIWLFLRNIHEFSFDEALRKYLLGALEGFDGFCGEEWIIYYCWNSGLVYILDGNFGRLKGKLLERVFMRWILSIF